MKHKILQDITIQPHILEVVVLYKNILTCTDLLFINY